MKRKIFCICLVLAVFAVQGLFATGQTAAGSGYDPNRTLMDRNTPATFSYWYPMHATSTPDELEGPGMQRLMQGAGVTIEWQPVPAVDVEARFNLLMASRNLPDVVSYNMTQLRNFPQAFQPIDGYVNNNRARYANIYAHTFNDDYLDAFLRSSDGGLRFIPMLATRRIGDILLMREDLLQRYAGGRHPVTAAEWEAVFIRARDDGKIPYMTRYQRNGILFRLLSGYMDAVREDYFVENGVVKYGVLDPRLREGVELARRWYQMGLIDNEYPTTQNTAWWEAVLRGDVFATHDNVQRIQAANNDFLNVQQPPNVARIIGVGPMQSPRTGTRHTVIHYPRVRHQNAGITLNARNPERILDFFDYSLSQEGFILTNFGVEGLSFNYVNGIPVPDPTYGTRRDRGEVPPIGSTMDMVKAQRDELLYDYNDPVRVDHRLTREATALYANNDFIQENWIASLTFTDEERLALAPINADLNTYRGEMLDRFIMGIEPMANWDNFVNQIQRMNLDTALRIHQAAFDRLAVNMR